MCKLSIIALATCILACTAQPVQSDAVDKDVPSEVLFRKGVSVTLKCSNGERNSKVKYSWSKDGTPIAEAKDYSYTIKSDQAEQEGEYQCHTESDLGVTTHIVKLKYTYLSENHAVPVEHKVVEGKPLGLKCDVPKGFPKPNIVWKKQTSAGASEDFTRRRGILADPNGNLWFSNMTKEDVDPKVKYLCIATSPAFDGERVLAQHVIKEFVKDPNPSDKELVEQYVSEDMVVKVGDLTYIYCIYGGTPLAFPDWFKDSKAVKIDSRVTDHNRSSGRRLLIKEVLPEDQATYTCKADNGVAKPKSHSMKLTVVSAPKFTKKAEAVTSAKEGQDIVIPCQVSAVPVAKVTWTHDANTLAAGGRVAITPEGLRIKGALKTDKGYYGCRAHNQYGDLYAETLVQF